MENLFEFVSIHLNDDSTRLILDRKKYPEIDMDLAVACIESRRKLKGKVQEWYNETRLIFPLKLSAEQCSSSATGRYKAELAERIVRESTPEKDWKIADLTGGLGVDSWFFSKKASQVLYNEMQEPLYEAARHNFKTLHADNILLSCTEVTVDTLSAVLKNFKADIIYMDPARRGEGGRKVFLIEECTPDVLTLKDEIFRKVRNILIKLSPMADITMVCERLGSTCREVHVVATGGECKELLIWMDREYDGEPTIKAVELNQDSIESTFSFTQNDEKSCWQVTPLNNITLLIDRDSMSLQSNCRHDLFIFEPGKALMKAGPFSLIATRFDLNKLGKSTHYYITDSPDKAAELKKYGKVFCIKESMTLDKRSIKDMGKKYPKAEVTARNIPMDTDTLRKKLGITSGDDAHIFGLKSDQEGNLLIAATRI